MNYLHISDLKIHNFHNNISVNFMQLNHPEKVASLNIVFQLPISGCHHECAQLLVCSAVCKRHAVHMCQIYNYYNVANSIPKFNLRRTFARFNYSLTYMVFKSFTTQCNIS
jgi:hypothetical protein